jgi:transaldolase
MNKKRFKSPLHETVSNHSTDFWNDSCSVEELTYAIDHGAVGATTNPVIVGEVLKKERHLWSDRIDQLLRDNPKATEDEIAWQLIEEMAVKGASLLKPIYDREKGKKGRISVQTNPKYFRDAERIVEQAVHLNSLAPNIQVKIPVTRAGVTAIEEATYRGVNINATVCFTVPQALASGEAVERGLKRREGEGKDVSEMSPVCTIMVGRIDDWLRFVADRDHIITDPGYFNWAGIAIMKKAYGLYHKRGYRARLLAAAYRCHMHWSEFIGGDLILTIPSEWQKRFNASDVEVIPRFDHPVDQRIVDELHRKFVEFRKAYDEDGLTIEAFDTFGATLRTLRQFLGGYDELVRTLRDRMAPNPDLK